MLIHKLIETTIIIPYELACQKDIDNTVLNIFNEKYKGKCFAGGLIVNGCQILQKSSVRVFGINAKPMIDVKVSTEFIIYEVNEMTAVTITNIEENDIICKNDSLICRLESDGIKIKTLRVGMKIPVRIKNVKIVPFKEKIVATVTLWSITRDYPEYHIKGAVTAIQDLLLYLEQEEFNLHKLRSENKTKTAYIKKIIDKHTKKNTEGSSLIKVTQGEARTISRGYPFSNKFLVKKYTGNMFDNVDASCFDVISERLKEVLAEQILLTEWEEKEYPALFKLLG